MLGFFVCKSIVNSLIIYPARSLFDLVGINYQKLRATRFEKPCSIKKTVIKHGLKIYAIGYDVQVITRINSKKKQYTYFSNIFYYCNFDYEYIKSWIAIHLNKLTIN